MFGFLMKVLQVVRDLVALADAALALWTAGTRLRAQFA